MDRYGNYYYQGSGLWRSLRDGDFEESEVWDVLREAKDPTSSLETSLPNDQTNQYSSSMHNPASAPKPMHQSGNIKGGSSSSPRSIFAHQSAPVNIPCNWSNLQKHLGRSKSSKASKSRRKWREEEDDEDEDEEDGEDGYGEKLPPHEYIAMRLARSKVSSFSVLEGVGRKLKGRDLSNVRNDVLTKTGFLESP